VKETYISVDIEAAGPVPPKYSMLSIGAVAVDDPGLKFYAELQPVTDKSVPAAMKVVGRPLKDFRQSGCEPKEAMVAFDEWLASLAGDGTLVFVGFNATFDWAFVNYYFHEHLDRNPFGFGGIDIKSYYMGMTGCLWKDTRSARIGPDLKGTSPHTHNALDDAIEQAEMFRKMRDLASTKK